MKKENSFFGTPFSYYKMPYVHTSKTKNSSLKMSCAFNKNYIVTMSRNCSITIEDIPNAGAFFPKKEGNNS